MINPIICLNGIDRSGEGKKFVRRLLNYIDDDKIKDDNHMNIASGK